MTRFCSAWIRTTVILQFVLGDSISLPEAPRQPRKRSWLLVNCRLGFPEEHFLFQRIIAHPPTRNIPRASPSRLISLGNQVLGEGEKIRSSLRVVDAGYLSLCQERVAFSRGPCAPRPASLLVGAKSDRGHGVLLGPRGHEALRPPGPLDFLCHLIIHDPHEHGFGWGCGVPRRSSGGSICTAARKSFFSW